MKKKSACRRAHVVAWLNKAEWDQVVDYLYSTDVSLQRFALRRISAWKSRYASSTPVAVGCTADLVRCQVLDRSGQLGADELVLLYGAALVRFVNLITERQQGRTARPLRRLAGNLNIPEWVVTLRHDVTHRRIPSLRWCRKGCELVMQWLQQEYWSRQLGAAPSDWDSASEGEEDQEGGAHGPAEAAAERQREMEAYRGVRDLLISYEAEQYAVMSHAPAQQEGGPWTETWPRPLADMTWILGEAKQMALESGELLADVLTEDGFLVPTVEQLHTLGCGGEEGVDLAQPHLPHAVLRFWLPLLRTLDWASFVHALLDKLLAELNLSASQPGAERRLFYVAAWIAEIVLCNGNRHQYQYHTKGQRRARARERLFPARLQLRWRQLLCACLQAPCRSSCHLLQVLLDDMDPPPPPGTAHRMLQLCRIYTQTHLPEAPPTPRPTPRQPVYTLEQLQERLREAGRGPPSAQESTWAGVGVAAAKELRGSLWQVCTQQVSWRSVPLGRVPGQSEEPSCLMVDAYTPMTACDHPALMESAAARTALGAAAGRAADSTLWSVGGVAKLKSGLQLF